MAARSALLILVVRDESLRRLLATRLCAMGVAVHQEPGLARMIRRPMVVLTGEAGLSGDLGEEIAAGWADGRWSRVATFTIDAPLPAGDPDWMLYASPSAALERTLAEWGALPDNSGDAVAMRPA